MITHHSSLDNFSEQIAYVLENYSTHGLQVSQFDNIILGGLGGSGIGALIAKNWFFDKIALPIELVSDYHLPKYVTNRTLVLLNSYSGNTEETLSIYAEAKEIGCTMVVLCSGGKIQELAVADGVKHYPLAKGYQPRMTIGYGLTYFLLILGDLMGQDLSAELAEVNDKLSEKKAYLKDSAKQIFDFFKGSIKHKFVINTDRFLAPLAVRFAQQVNENAKLEAFVNVLPEANHNVIESYVEKLPTNFIMLYTDKNPRVAARFDFLTSFLELENNKVLPMYVPDYELYTLYDITYRLDWVSVMLADEIDAPLMEVPIITELKEYLSNLEIVDADDEQDSQ